MPDKEFRDAVHGDIRFDSFEWNVINTPEYQRMRGIRQLGLAHLVYPSAQHGRFEHSLGVAHMSSRILEAVLRNGGHVTDHEIKFVRALAMIHDIGHIPYGHTLEDERPIYSKADHHDCEPRLSLFLKDTELSKALESLGKAIARPRLSEDLIKVMKLTHEEEEAEEKLSAREKFFAFVVGNTICGDLLDYLKRDPFFTGLQHRYDDSIIAAFKLKDDTIYLDLDDGGRLNRKIASEILHLLRLRYTLGERVYYHPTKSAASAMISKAVELSGLSAKAVASFRDEELLFVLENAGVFEKVANGESIKNAGLVRAIVRAIRRRKLFVPAYTLTAERAEHFRGKLVDQYHDPGQMTVRARVESDLAKKIGVGPNQVIIYCPDKGMATKAAMVNVRWPNENTLQPLQKLCEEGIGIEDKSLREEIMQLKGKHLALWQMTVFLDPECADRCTELAAHCQKQFYNLPNCLPGSIPTSVEGVRDRLILSAITSYPRPEELDLPACHALLSADFFEEQEVWTVEGIQAHLPKKNTPSFTQPTLLAQDGDDLTEGKRRPKRDQGVGKKSQ
jgi:uncharacterized protein